jgi:predicted nucleotidyltransferase component of viral defense system
MFTDPMQKREVFHLEFLRALARGIPASSFVLKGGGNLRFYFGSSRYSEDLDLDIAGVAVHVLRDKVMAILGSSVLAGTLRTFGIERIRPPSLAVAKQTETVQRFKVHLLTGAGEDLGTKVEFSRRGLDGPVRVEPVLAPLLAGYRMAPLLLPHYTAAAALRQKIRALIGRRQPEARDVFDLYVLSTQPEVVTSDPGLGLAPADLRRARERVHSLDYERYRGTVVAFLGAEDQAAHGSSLMWDQIRLVAVNLIERGLPGGA